MFAPHNHHQHRKHQQHKKNASSTVADRTTDWYHKMTLAIITKFRISFHFHLLFFFLLFCFLLCVCWFFIIYMLNIIHKHTISNKIQVSNQVFYFFELKKKHAPTHMRIRNICSQFSKWAIAIKHEQPA